MMSTDETPSFTERNSGYYERNSRLVAEHDSYLRRTNNNRNGPFTTASVLVERSSNSNTNSPKHQPNNRVPSTSSASWYDTVATSTNGPGGSGNVGALAAGGQQHHHHHHHQQQQQQHYTTSTAATHTSTALNSSPTPPTPASSILATTPSSSATSTSLGSALYQRGSSHDSSSLSKRNKLNKLLKTSSAGSSLQSAAAAGGESPQAATTTTTTFNNSSCSTINSNNNNISSSSSNSIKSTTINCSSGSGNSIGNSILNALTTNPASASSTVAAGNCSTSHHHHHHQHHHSYGGDTNAYSSSTSTQHNTTSSSSAIASSSNSTTSQRLTHHGRSTTSSSRSHSRSPSSYSSSHSSSSSSHASSSRSHASSPILASELAASSLTRSGTAGRSSHMQSTIATPTQGSSHHNTTGGGCSSSSSSSSSGSCTATTPVVHSEDNRPLAIRVRNLPARSSDTSLKDGLFHEYKKHGKVTWVKVVGQNSERYALVCFKKPDDVEKALEVSHDKLFFGCKIEVEPYQGYDVEDNEFRPYEAELDEYHPKSTRTLFIGNLEKDITATELRSHFDCFGEIIEIDIKKQGMNAYAFCQYSDIISVVKAMRKMDGEHLGSNRIKLGFGKSMPTNCVWIDGIGDKISESHLQSQFSRYGAVTKVIVDRARQLALVLYEQIQYAQTAVKEMRGTTLRGRRLQVDFASRECQDAFYEKLEKQNSGGGRFSRYDSQSRSRASSFSRHQNSNDGCSPSNTPGSSSGSSVSGVVPPTLSSAIVAGGVTTVQGGSSSSNSSGQVTTTACGSLTPARSRGPRSMRSHTIDFDYGEIRRFRAYDEYSQGSAASHDEDIGGGGTPKTPLHNAFASGVASSGLRSDSPLLSRLGPIVGSAASNAGGSDTLEVTLGSSSRRRCDKSPAKQKGDIRFLQKERFHLLEQLEECPSSGDENTATPRKRIRLDHHHSNSLTSGLLHSSQDALSSVGETHRSNLNSNCDSNMHDAPLHRKADIRRSSDFGKYPPQTSNLATASSATTTSTTQHYQHQHSQQAHLNRRPSNELVATTADPASSVRHNSTSSSSSEHYAQHHQVHGGGNSSAIPCKRRRVVGSSNAGSGNSNNSAFATSSALMGVGGSGVGDEYHQHHASRGRGHSLHSHHSHEASCGESADGSRPGTPLCDERPEVLPTEPRRVPRERPNEPMVLPLPKFGIQFFQQYRNSAAANTGSNAFHQHQHHHHHHHHHQQQQQHSLSSSSLTLGSGFGQPNSHITSGGTGGNSSSHSSLNHNMTSASSASTAQSQSMAHLPSPSSRYTPWRPQQPHPHAHHGPSASSSAAAPGSTISPMRSRSLSSNSSDSEAQAHTGSSPSLEERIRTLDEMYERWSGGSGTNPNAIKRVDPWQSVRSSMAEHSSSNSMHSAPSNSPTATSTTAASRLKFRDVNELPPSDIVKSVLAKKSLFDDDLQRLTSSRLQPTASDVVLPASSGLPNLGAANKSPIVGCSTTNACRTAAAGSLLQRLSSLSPMNSPQASMSPYNSPSPSPSVGLSFANNSTISKPHASVAAAMAMTASAATATPTATLPGNATTKGLQYPFPSHPPLPNTAAPAPVVQPPPPAEQIKHTEPNATEQQDAAAEPVAAISASNKPKPNITKSNSVPTEATTSSLQQSDATDAVRVLTKSVSVPGSTNVGTVKTKSSPDSAIASGSSSSTTCASSSSPASNGSSEFLSNDKTESDNVKGAKNATAKKHEKTHNKHDKKPKHEKATTSERRKKSLSSTPRVEEESSDDDASAGGEKDALERDKSQQSSKEKDKDKERQEREKLERQLKKQQEKEAQEREKREAAAQAALEKAEREERERLEVAERRQQQEELERKQREEKERERERLEAAERRQQQQQEEQERKQREENERKLQAQRDRKLEVFRRQKDDDRRSKDETERRAENAVEQVATSNIAAVADNKQTNKDIVASKSESNTEANPTSKHLHGGHKSSRSQQSPTRHPKRRLSSQESTNSLPTTNAESQAVHAEDNAKRARTDSQQQTTTTHGKEPKKHHHHHHKHHSSSNSSHSHKSNSSEHVAPTNVATAALAVNEEVLEKPTKTKEHVSSKNKSSRHYHNKNEAASDAAAAAANKQHLNSSPEQLSTSEKSTNQPHEANISDNEQVVPLTISILKQSSTDDEAQHNAPPKTPSHTAHGGSGHHKHREHHTSSSSSSRHKSKRDHRDKKRHSLTESITMTDEEMPGSGAAANRRISIGGTSAASDTAASGNTTTILTPTGRDLLRAKAFEQSLHGSMERKLSRCSDDGGNNLQPNTPTSRNKPPGTLSRKVIMSSADSDDSEDTAAAKKRSIFEVPDEGPYVSMYDKVKARSCKNMQKQEEEKKIRAKFSQLKKSRAKREGKKRSASYDGDSDSEFEGGDHVHHGQQHKSRNYGGGLSSSSDGGEPHDDDERHDNDDDDDEDSGIIRRRSSQASSTTQRKFSDSDSNLAEDAARRIRMQQNLRRLCDNDDSSDDEINSKMRRHSPSKRNSLTNKRNSHAIQRIASDSESQSQSAISELKIKQEPQEIVVDVKHEIKEEPYANNDSDFEFKCKRRSSVSSIDEHQHQPQQQQTSPAFTKIKAEDTIKQENKLSECVEYFGGGGDGDSHDYKLHEQKLKTSTADFTPDSTRKKHKKSKKRPKNSTQTELLNNSGVNVDNDAASMHHQFMLDAKSNDLFAAAHNHSDDNKKHNTQKSSAPPTTTTPPMYDVFDELKRQCIVGKFEASTPTTATIDAGFKEHKIAAELCITAEKKRHKERKEKKREKLRNIGSEHEAISTANESSHDTEKLTKEERHRLKKAKKSKSSLEALRRDTTTAVAAAAQTLLPTKRIEGKLEDIFGPLSDEDEEDESQLSDGECKLNSFKIGNMHTPNASPYKQAPLTPKSHTVEENEENILKVGIIGGNGASITETLSNFTHAERERGARKEKRDKKRRKREKSREQREQQQQRTSGDLPEDENSVDLDEAGRALEAQLMQDFDNKMVEDATPSTATTYRSDMTDIFRFPEGDENSVELLSDPPHPPALKREKEKKKKNKRSKEEKHHQRRESSSSASNASQQQTATMSPPVTAPSGGKLTIDIQAATKHSQKLEKQAALHEDDEDEHENMPSTPLCKPSPSLPCLIGDDDDVIPTQNHEEIHGRGKLTKTPATPSQKAPDRLSLSPMREKKMISPIPKTPTTTTTPAPQHENEHATNLTPNTPVTAAASSDFVTPTTPTSSREPNNKEHTTSTPSSSSNNNSCSNQKKKPEIFIPGFDGELDEQIKESAVQSIAAELNAPVLDPTADEPKIPIESPPDGSKQLQDKHEDTKSRVQISQEETESAVSALLGESFGNSSTADFDAYNDVSCLDDLSSASVPAVDEEAAIAARALESSLKEQEPININEVEDDDRDEISLAVQSLGTVVDIPDIKPPDTPQSERGLQIDTDTEDTNTDDLDSSGNSLKIDETVGDKIESTTKAPTPTMSASVITKVATPEAPTKTAVEKIAAEENKNAMNKAKEAPTATETNAAKANIIAAPVVHKSTLPSMMSLDELTPVHTVASSISTATTTAVATTVSTTSSPAPKVVLTAKSPLAVTVSSAPAPLMQPPTISIPDVPTHFAMPQMMPSPRTSEQQANLSPRLHINTSTAAATAANQHIAQMRANSPQILRQLSPGISSPTAVQQQQQLASPKALMQPQQQQLPQPQSSISSTGNLKQNTQQPPAVAGTNDINKIQRIQQQASPLSAASAINEQKQQQSSPTNIGSQQKQQQQQMLSKSVIEHCAIMQTSSSSSSATTPTTPISTTMTHGPPLPITVQKMPPVSTHHPTIISKVVNVQPQQAQQLPSPTRLLPSPSQQQQQHQQQMGHIAPITSMSKTITNPYMVQQQQQQQLQNEQHFTQPTNQQPQQHQRVTAQQKLQVTKPVGFMPNSPTATQIQSPPSVQVKTTHLTGQASVPLTMPGIPTTQQNAIYYRQQQQNAPLKPQQQSPLQQHQQPPTSVAAVIGQQQQQQQQHTQSSLISSHPITSQSIIVQQQIVGRPPYAQHQHQMTSVSQAPLALSTTTSAPVASTTTAATSSVSSAYIPPQQINSSIIIEPKTLSSESSGAANDKLLNTSTTAINDAKHSKPIVDNVSVIRTPPTTARSNIIESNNLKAKDQHNTSSEQPWSKDGANVNNTTAAGSVIKKINKIEEPKAAAASMPNISGISDSTPVAKSTTITTAEIDKVKELEKSMSSTDHDTEDETETKQHSTQPQPFDPIKLTNTVGAKIPRGGGAKRGRQPRGGKKQAATLPLPIIAPVETELGIQTRLRKPIAVTPATRGRKGRPPRNALLAQRAIEQQVQQEIAQQQQQKQAAVLAANQPLAKTQTSAPPPTIAAATEKKTRNQLSAGGATVDKANASDQDVYEFHDDAADDGSKSTSKVAAPQSDAANVEDLRPRLILTIKSPGATPSVKATEKPVDPLAITPMQQSELLAASQQHQSPEEQNAANNTRKSRRLQEKDRSTIDDIIEDVVRNTQTPPPPISVLPLPKGAQTPPRRSGRNATINPKKSETPVATPQQPAAAAAVPSIPQPVTTPNAVGRPRRSKDRKISGESGNVESPTTNDNLQKLSQQQQPIAQQQQQQIPQQQKLPPQENILPSKPIALSEREMPALIADEKPPVPAQQQQQSQPQPQQQQPVAFPQQPQHHLQHPKKKAIAAAEIESYAAAVASVGNQPPSSLPPGGLPMLHTAAPATHKHTGGTADVLNKSLIDPVTGLISGMQQGKEGNLPLATAAVKKQQQQQQPQRTINENNNQPKQTSELTPLQHTAAAANAAVIQKLTTASHVPQVSTLASATPLPPCSIATPITALTKPVQAEAAASATATTLTVPASLANKPVSVVVKTSVAPPPAPQPMVIQQQIVQPTTQQATATPSATLSTSVTPLKQPILMQQSQLIMHAQHSNVRPPTLKAHVLNSQKQLNSQQQTTLTPIPAPNTSQIHHHQQQKQQPTIVISSGNMPNVAAPPTQTKPSAHHVIQSNIVARHNLQMPTANHQQHQHQQLLVNIPPAHSPSAVAAANQALLNSPRMQPQSTLVIKQGTAQMPTTASTGGPQVLHVVSSKAPPPPTQAPQQQTIYQQQAQHAYIPTTAASRIKQQQQITVVPLDGPHQAQQQSQMHVGKQQQPHITLQQKQLQPTMGVSIVAHQQQPPPPTQQQQSQQKQQQQTLVMPPGHLPPQLGGLQPHPTMVLQTKSMPAHLQHVQQLTPSPPAVPMGKQNSTVHSLQTQSATPIMSSSPPAALKAQQPPATMLAGNPANLRAAIPTISPQGQARVTPLLLPTGMPVNTFEHDIGKYGSSQSGTRVNQSPPPAHQQQASPITPGESAFAAGPLRGVPPTRENFMIYQQLMRPQDALNTTLRCANDYEEKLIGSSRPGSVPRTITVPHSLQSPQDRTSDSPQAAQIYVHNARIPPPPPTHSHYAPEVGANRTYYDATGRPITIEPPPAHRSAAATSSSPFLTTPPAVHPPPPPSTPTAVASHMLAEREREREQQLQREHERLKMSSGGVVALDNTSAGVVAASSSTNLIAGTGASARNMQVATPPTHPNQVQQAQQPPPQQPGCDSLLTLLQRYPVMWQGLLALKTDQAAVQMHFVFGNPHVARASLPCNSDGSTPPLRIAQRMRLEQTQLEGVAKKMQYENEHCMLLALPCGRDHADVLQHSRNLQTGFITYLQQKMAAGIVNIPMPGSEQAAYVVHIFPSCDFANENLERAAPDLKNRVAEIAHLLIVIATV